VQTSTFLKNSTFVTSGETKRKCEAESGTHKQTTFAAHQKSFTAKNLKTGDTNWERIRKSRIRIELDLCDKAEVLFNQSPK
jgi:hypothetical protein